MKWFLCIFLLISCTSAGKILFLVPFNGPSHWLFLSHFIRELLNRGHHVTTITGVPYKDATHKNYTEILIDPPYDFSVKVSKEAVFNAKYTSPYASVQWLYEVGLDNSEHGLKHPKVQELINSQDKNFDLVICEQFYEQVWLMFAHKFRTPIVTISSMGYSDYMDYANGMVTPWAYVPHLLVNFSDKMSFRQRCENALLSLYDKYLRSTYFMPQNNQLAQKYFKSVPNKPSIEELERRIDIMLVNFNHAISKPRPQMPNQINIGGAHIKPVSKPLPNDLQKFLDEAEHGVVYMSLGAYVQSALMPKEKVQEIISAFSKLKQRVLWKFESETTPNLPPNVMVRKWMPQADILAHKNIRLFITHGGMFGTTEATYNGLPMLFIPFYGDQHRNSLKAIASGVALAIKFTEITSDSLSSKLNELLTNPSYMKNAREIGRIFRDNPMHPMDTAMFHIEYVMRHKGAKYLKSAAVELKWYQHLFLDVLGLLLCVVTLIYMSVKFILMTLLKMITNSKSNSSVKSKKS